MLHVKMPLDYIARDPCLGRFGDGFFFRATSELVSLKISDGLTRRDTNNITSFRLRGGPGDDFFFDANIPEGVCLF